jgi:hypothetical protein
MGCKVSVSSSHRPRFTASKFDTALYGDDPLEVKALFETVYHVIPQLSFVIVWFRYTNRPSWNDGIWIRVPDDTEMELGMTMIMAPRVSQQSSDIALKIADFVLQRAWSPALLYVQRHVLLRHPSVQRALVPYAHALAASDVLTADVIATTGDELFAALDSLPSTKDQATFAAARSIRRRVAWIAACVLTQ